MSGRILILAFIALLVPLPVLALDSTSAPSQPDVGMDLGLHWGMTASDATQVFPALNAIADTNLGYGEPADDPKLATAGTVVTSYAGCSVGITLKFFRDYLDQVSIATQMEPHVTVKLRTS